MKRPILLCLILVVLISACSSTSTSSLTGVAWTVTSLSGVGVDPSVTMTANFSTDGKLSGNGGCNEYGADYTTSGSSLTISSPMSSMMSCAEAVDQQESEYLYLLENSSTFEIKGSKLTIKDSTGQPIIEYTSAS